MRGRLALLGLALAATACGGGGSSPSGPSVAPTPVTGPNSLTGLVFYDENGNGSLDGGENVRIPGVRVSIGSQAGSTDATGHFTASSLPSGAQTVSIQTDSLPSYFQPGTLAAVTLPISAGSVVPVPVTLSIGKNRPNTYLAFGDSITEGDGSGGSDGWTVGLEGRLRSYWSGPADVIKDGVAGTRSDDGATRLPRSLADEHPAFVLILYGTNDWNKCGALVPEACFTVTELRDMVRRAKAENTLPVVGTIIPANPLFTDRGAFERNRWIKAENELIKKMAQEEGAVVADTHTAFGDESGWASLFFDHVHPDDDGYAKITEAFFQALTRARGSK
jgi:lysophospholipase L1-like esterase